MKFIQHVKDQWNKNFTNKLIITLLIILLLSIIVFIISLFSNWRDSNQNQELNASLQSNTIAPSETTLFTEAESDSTTETTISESDENTLSKIDFASLQEENPDTVAWIEVPGSVINYPVVQSEDNEFYLHKDFSGNESKAGSIFLDYRNSGLFTDRHSILYGHHMRDGSMFAGLMAYKDPDFFSENDTIFIDMPDGRTTWQIFSAYVTTTDFYYIITDFEDDQEFSDFLRTIEGKSLFPGTVSSTASDNLLTLSTCTYEYDDARFVVHAIRID